MFAPQAIEGMKPPPAHPCGLPFRVALSDVFHTQLPPTFSLQDGQLTPLQDEGPADVSSPPPACCHGNGRRSCSCRILLSCNLPPSLSFPPSFSHTKRKHKCFIFILQRAVQCILIGVASPYFEPFPFSEPGLQGSLLVGGRTSAASRGREAHL